MISAKLADKELLAIEIGTTMKFYKNPIITVTGDLNHRDIGGAINKVGTSPHSPPVLPMGPTPST